jgi:hypothetical protein
MAASNAEIPQHPVPRTPMSLDELARLKGVRPVESIHDLACPDVFETDSELDDFFQVKPVKNVDHIFRVNRSTG